MTDNIMYFHFTLGPVQSFVAQARRTRDFWSGSFLLSWLSGVAMREVMAQCEDDRDCVLFPKPDFTFIDWLEGSQGSSSSAPKQGCIPNRFKAQVNKNTFKPDKVVLAVNQAWQALATLVYEHDFTQSNLTQKPDKALWDRQIKASWDMTWVLTDEVTDNDGLNERKNWRNYRAPDEPGVKCCMMMSDWQELSSVPTHNETDLTAFWQPLRHSSAKLKSDLRDNEYLCAIAYVKRRFARFFSKLSEPMPTGWTVNGWDVEEGRSSVSYMAAVHWLEETLKQAKQDDKVKEKLWAFHDAAFELTNSYSAWGNDIACIKQVKSHRKWQALEGDVFFKSVLENDALYKTEDKKAQAKKTLQCLKALQKETGLGEPSSFYAVLMMDGDSLGKQMKFSGRQPIITQGLKTFTGEVSGLVYQHNGFLMYAGGDDVLAVLPIEDAMSCALAIRECYEGIFKPYQTAEHKTSISAAIEYVSIRMPLTKVLRDAHRLLDDVAKKRCGRDAIAVRVWKPGGKALEWFMPWECAIDEKSGCKQLTLDRMATDFKNQLTAYKEYGEYSNTFFYKIRERLELLNPADDDKDSVSVLSADNGQAAVDLMAAEYIASGLCRLPTLENSQYLAHAKAVVEPLLAQCYIKTRHPITGNIESRQGIYKSDAALLLRFLAQKEVW